MAGNDKQKQSLYFPEDMLSEIMREANRLDRSLSWMVQHAWRIAREDVKKFPSVDVRALHPLEPRPRSQPRLVGSDEPGAQVRDFIKGKFEKEAS